MKSKKGFTLIELTLAIAFISILLITIGVVTMDIISTYQKGVAMKSVNTVGLDLIREFSSTISDAPTIDSNKLCDEKYPSDDAQQNSCKNDGGKGFFYQEYTVLDIYINDELASGDYPVVGAFCNGSYSYLWNTGYALNHEIYKNADGSDLPRATLYYDSGSKSDFRLLKIKDKDRKICANRLKTDMYEYDKNDHNFFIDSAEEPLELLPATNEKAGLAIYDLEVSLTNKTDNSAFYSASMQLATIVGGVDILKGRDYCTAPKNEFGGDFNYCAINKFNFAMRATGEKDS